MGVAEKYRQVLASNPDGEITLQTFEVYHPLFSRRYYFVIDTVQLTAFLETGLQVTFEPVKAEAKNAANNGDMNQQATFTVADPTNMLDDELDRIPLDNEILPELTFRAYLLSDVSEPAAGPVVYEAQDINQGKGTFTAVVSAPKLNNRSTGLLLTPELCPLIRGFMT